MAKYKFLQIDAFTNVPFGGNPCAVLFNTDRMPESQMLAIAKEMNLSETSFLFTSKRADFGARYFTPAEEIPLAGHPTIATIFALINQGDITLDKAYQKVTLELKAGIIPIEIHAKGNQLDKIVMSQKKPEFLSIHPKEKIAQIFNLNVADILSDVPIQTVSTGTPQLLIPVQRKEALKKVNMDLQRYLSYRQKSDFFSAHLFCLEGATEQGDTFARHFAAFPGHAFEDPFTGSATGAMAAYLWSHGLLDRSHFTAEQGHWMDRPGSSEVEIIGPRENVKTVKVAGQAVLVIRGELEI